MTPQSALQFLVQVCGETIGIPLKNFLRVQQAAKILAKAIETKPEEVPPAETPIVETEEK